MCLQHAKQKTKAWKKFGESQLFLKHAGGGLMRGGVVCVVPRFCINTLNHVKIRVKLSRNAKTPGRRDSGAPRARRECIQPQHLYPCANILT